MGRLPPSHPLKARATKGGFEVKTRLLFTLLSPTAADICIGIGVDLITPAIQNHCLAMVSQARFWRAPLL